MILSRWALHWCLSWVPLVKHQANSYSLVQIRRMR